MSEGRAPLWTFLSSSLAGGLSGIVSKTSAAPIERVKLILQTQRINQQIDPSMHYKGPIDCVKRVYHEQGISSFWRGNVANVARYFPSQAILFGLKDSIKSLLSLNV